MRTLTDKEQAEISHRQADFDNFLDERMPVLCDFIQQLGLPDAPLVLSEADRFMPPIDRWLTDQVVTSDDRTWILTRLGYFIGEYLVQRYAGHWFLNKIPDSRFFGRYVVGQFVKVTNQNAMVDPFAVADAYLLEPPGRSLSRVLGDVDNDLSRA